MTIAAGFISPDGCVLCADSEESLKGYYKQMVDKIDCTFFPETETYFAFCGSGSPDPLEGMKQAIVEALNVDSTKPAERVSAAVAEYYKTHIWPDPDKPQIAAMMYVGNRTKSWLLKNAFGSAVTHCPDYGSVGIGAPVADRWYRRLFWAGTFNRSLMDLVQLGLYIVWRAKSETEGVSGPTRLMAFTSEGVPKTLTHFQVHSMHEEFFSRLDSAYHGLVRDLACMTDPKQIEAALQSFVVYAQEQLFHRNTGGS